MYTKDTNLLAEEFNAFFTSVGVHTANLSEKLGADYNLPQILLPQNVVLHELDEFDFKVVTPEEISRTKHLLGIRLQLIFLRTCYLPFFP